MITIWIDKDGVASSYNINGKGEQGPGYGISQYIDVYPNGKIVYLPKNADKDVVLVEGDK